MKRGAVKPGRGRIEDVMVFTVRTVTVIVNESVRSIGLGGIIQTVIRLEEAPGSWILTLSNPLTG